MKTRTIDTPAEYAEAIAKLDAPRITEREARAIIDQLHAYNRTHYAIRLIDAYAPGNGRPATRGTRIS